MKKILTATPVASSFFLSFFLSVILVSCEKDESIIDAVQEEVAPDNESIASARDWFYTHTGGDVILEEQSQTKSTSNSTVQHPLLGDWESGLTSSVGNVKNVEVPVYSVDNEESYAEAINGTGNLKSGKTGKNEENLSSRTRFVVQTDEETGETRGFMMTVIPDEDFLASGGTIGSMDYYNRGTDFSGLIVFNHLDGSFANAWEYEEGEIIEGFVRGRIEKENSQLKKVAAFAVIECTICYETWVTTGGVSYYNGTTCYQRYETALVWTDGYGVGGGGGGASSSPYVTYRPSGGGGGSSSGSSGINKGEYLPYDIKTECPLFISISRRNNLNPTQTLLLEDALKELIGVCSDEYIYNEFVDQGMKFNFEMDSSLDGFAGYDPVSKTFSFLNNDAISSGKLKEEFFHAFQDAFYPGGTSQYGTTGKVNIEFEAKFYRDITAANCCSAFYDTSAPQAVLKQYTTWVQSLQVNPLSILSKDYQKWLKLFNQYTNSYNSPLSSNLSYPHAIDHIINMSNCF